MKDNKKERKLFGVSVPYTSRYDLIKKSIELYSTVRYVTEDVDRLRRRLVEVLAFYVLYGYNSKAKKMIQESLGVSVQNINQMNAELLKLGYLSIDQYNLHNRIVHPELVKMGELYAPESEELSSVRAMVIRFDGKIHS